jgi:hypothetical protein
MPRHINSDTRPKRMPPADEMNTALQTAEHLPTTVQQLQPAIDAMIQAMRRKATQIRQRHACEVERARRPKGATPSLPAPITAFLTGFVEALTTKFEAIAAALTPEERARLRAIAPGFIRAVLHDESDVRAMVGLLLQMEPWLAAMIISAYLPDFERRFAS